MGGIDFIVDKVGHVYGACAIVAACLFFPKFYIKSSRKDDKKPAPTYEKIATWICSIGIMAMVSGWYAMNNKSDKLAHFLAAFIILFVPTAFSLSYGYGKDSKLTIEQRRKIKKEIEDLNRMP